MSNQRLNPLLASCHPQTCQSLPSQIRHDLRTPINAIIGYSEMLLEDLITPEDAQAVTQVQRIQSCGLQLLTIVNTVLDPGAERLDQPSSLRSALEQLRSQIQPPVDLILDQCHRLLQYAWNERLDASSIPTDLEKIQAATQRLQLRLHDMVTGLPSDAIAHPSDSDRATSNPFLTSPIPILQEPSHWLKTDERQSSPTMNWGSILIVDEPNLQREWLAQQLIAQGHQVTCVEQTFHAIHIIATQSYDLIIVNMICAKIQGDEILRTVNAEFVAEHRASLIVLVNLDDRETLISAMKQGADDYLLNPIDPALFPIKITACLEKHQWRNQQGIGSAQGCIAAAVPVPIVIARLSDYGIVYANPSATKVLELPSHHLLHTCLQDIGRSPAEIQSLLNVFHRDGRVQYDELQCQTMTGEPRWMSVSLQALTFNHEPAVLMMLNDITHQKQTEAKLQLMEERYQQFFEQASEGIFQMTLEGQYLNINPAFATLYGYDSCKEMMERCPSLNQPSYVEPNCRDRFWQLLQTAGEVKDFKYKIYHPDRRVVWISERVRLVCDRAGQSLYYEGVATDITAHQLEVNSLRSQLEKLKVESETTSGSSLRIDRVPPRSREMHPSVLYYP